MGRTPKPPFVIGNSKVRIVLHDGLTLEKTSENGVSSILVYDKDMMIGEICFVIEEGVTYIAPKESDYTIRRSSKGPKLTELLDCGSKVIISFNEWGNIFTVQRVDP